MNPRTQMARSIVSETIICFLVPHGRNNLDARSFNDNSPHTPELFSVYITHASSGALRKCSTSTSLSSSHALVALWWDIIYILKNVDLVTFVLFHITTGSSTSKRTHPPSRWKALLTWTESLYDHVQS